MEQEMPDWMGESDDDEWLEPWYNDPGEFGDRPDDEDE